MKRLLPFFLLLFLCISASSQQVIVGHGVRTVNTLKGDVTLAAGSNVTITPSGQTLTIASSGGGGGGANTALSNLASVAVNVDVLPGVSNTIGLGSTSNFWTIVDAVQFSSGNQEINMQRNKTTPSGVTGVGALFSVFQAAKVGVWTASDGSVDALATGALYLETGNKTGGTGNSGDIKLKTGTSAGGTRGVFSVDANIIPASNNVYNIGDATHKIQNIDIGNAINSGGSLVMAPGAFTLYSNTGNNSIDFANLNLFDPTGAFTTVDYGLGSLNNVVTGTFVLGWHNGLSVNYDIQNSSPANIPDGAVQELIDPVGPQATFTVKMPPNPDDGQIVYISTSQTITAITVSPNSGQSIVGVPTTMNSTSPVAFIYINGNTTWYRH